MRTKFTQNQCHNDSKLPITPDPRPPKHVSLARVPNPQDISYPYLIAIWSKNPKNHTSCEPSMFQRRLNHFEIAQFSNYLQLNPKARPVISSSDQKANRSFDAIFPSKLVQLSSRSSSSGLPTGRGGEHSHRFDDLIFMTGHRVISRGDSSSFRRGI